MSSRLVLMPAKPDPAHIGPWKAAYSGEANKWYWWHQQARISSWDLPVSPEAHSPAFGLYGAALHGASGAQQHGGGGGARYRGAGGPPQANEQRHQLESSPEVFFTASTASATYRPPEPKQPPPVSMDCRACTVHQTVQKPQRRQHTHAQQYQQSPVSNFTAVTVPVMAQQDRPQVQQRPRPREQQPMGQQAMGLRQGLGTSSPQRLPQNALRDCHSIPRRGPAQQNLGPWPATYHAVAVQCSRGTPGADRGTSAVVPVAAAAGSPAHHLMGADGEPACALCGMSSKPLPEEARILPEANDDGHRKRRRMKKSRSSNTLGKWWRKYGYCGAAYCQKCSEIFRDHLLRQISNSAHCSRKCPCVDCQRVLCKMGNQTLEQLWAKVDAGAASVTPGDKKKARTEHSTVVSMREFAGVGVPVTETTSLEVVGATFVSGQKFRQGISVSSQPANFGCGDNYPSSHQSPAAVPVRFSGGEIFRRPARSVDLPPVPVIAAKRETAGHYPNPVEEQQRLRISHDRAHRSAGDYGPSWVADAQAYDYPMAGDLEIAHRATTPPVTDTPQSVDSAVTDVGGPVMYYSRGDAEEWSYSKCQSDEEDCFGDGEMTSTIESISFDQPCI